LYSFKSNVSFFSSLCRNKAFEDHGIELTGEVKVNLKNGCSLQAVVDQTSGGVKYLMDKNNIT
jgi:dihydrolipoamide dehydrogenase